VGASRGDELDQSVRQQRKKKEARRVLAQAYNPFTEGFTRRDLPEAKALLAQLQSKRGQRFPRSPCEEVLDPPPLDPYTARLT
jgi:hypothetical protein